MNSNNEAKSREPPHSASASRQQQQKKPSSNAITALLKSSTSTQGNKNDKSIGKLLLEKIQGRKGRKKEGTAKSGALTNSSLINAAPSELKAAAAHDSGIAYAAAPPSELKIAATSHSIGGNIASAPSSDLNAALRTFLFDPESNQSIPVYVLSKRPCDGKPMAVIAALDKLRNGEINIARLLQVDNTNFYHMNASGKKISLSNHEDAQGNSVNALWVVPQKCGEAETILYKGKQHTIPKGKVAKCFDETVFPLQKKIDDRREAVRYQRKTHVSLTATIGGKSYMLATLPFQKLASKVLKIKAAECKVGKTIRGVQYVHTEVVDGKEVETFKTVDVTVRDHKESDGAIGVTTEVGRMVLPRPHLVMPIDAMPLQSNGSLDFRLDNLQKVSAEYRVSILSEFAIIPEVVEKEISAYLINLEVGY